MKKLLLALLFLLSTAAHGVTCSTFAAGDLNYISKLNLLANGCSAPSPGVGAFTNLSLSGTAGAGYLEMVNQSAAPATPTSAGRVYFDSSNRLSWRGTNGFTRTFDGTANTANRIYVLPDSAGTMLLDSATQTVSGVKTFGSAGAVGKLAIAGTTSGSTVLNASAVASGTLTLPAATDTLVGKATTDTLTNKTLTTPVLNAATGTSLALTGLVNVGDASAVSGQIQLGLMISTDTAAGQVLMMRKSVTASNGPNFQFLKSRGTAASPSVGVSGDTLMGFNGLIFDGSVYASSVGIAGLADGTPSVGSTPGKLTFSTSPTGASAIVTRMSIGADGNTSFGAITPSAWSTASTTSYATQMGNGATFAFGGSLGFANNLYFDGTNWRYVTTAAGANIQLGSTGAMTFFTAPSGTAGAVATLTNQVAIANTGLLTANQGINIAGGASAAGSIYKIASDGFNIVGSTGSGTDFRLINPAGSAAIIANPTGTLNLTYTGRAKYTSTAPTPSSCGTSPTVAGSDTAGLITVGSGATTACTVTFSSTWTTAPYCVLSWQTNLVSMQYTVSATAISITQTGTASDKINYICMAS